jgi:hypothetical protein
MTNKKNKRKLRKNSFKALIQLHAKRDTIDLQEELWDMGSIYENPMGYCNSCKASDYVDNKKHIAAIMAVLDERNDY